MIKTTLWDMLSHPMGGLHLPRFALFLLLAIPLELYCDVKSRCFKCSFTTILLQLVTGISYIVASYFLLITSFPLGERLTMPPWYWPLTIAGLAGATVVFAIGIRSELRKKQRRLSAIRTTIFLLTLYFAVMAVQTPLEVNAALEESELRERQRRQTLDSPTDPSPTDPTENTVPPENPGVDRHGQSPTEPRAR